MRIRGWGRIETATTPTSPIGFQILGRLITVRETRFGLISSGWKPRTFYCGLEFWELIGLISRTEVGSIPTPATKHGPIA